MHKGQLSSTGVVSGPTSSAASQDRSAFLATAVYALPTAVALLCVLLIWGTQAEGAVPVWVLAVRGAEERCQTRDSSKSFHWEVAHITSGKRKAHGQVWWGQWG